MDKLEIPFHRPTYDIGLTVKQGINDKLSIISQNYFLGGIETLATNGETISLNKIFDLNFRTDYKFREKIYLFILIHSPAVAYQFRYGL